jgi:hypothetical protein
MGITITLATESISQKPTRVAKDKMAGYGSRNGGASRFIMKSVHTISYKVHMS